MIFRIKIADCLIQIESIHSDIYKMCQDYLVDQMDIPCDLSLVIEESDIDYEEMKAAQEVMKAGSAKKYSRGYLETLAVYRKIANAILDYDTFLMHGAVFGVGQEAYMITAKSGTGKTTVLRNILKNQKDAYVINGDKPLLRWMKESMNGDTRLYVCGTPWAGKEKMQRNIMVPLKAIYFLERGQEDKLDTMEFFQALPKLLQQTYRPAHAEGMSKTMELISRMNGRVEMYGLTLKYYDDVAEVGKGIKIGCSCDFIR